MLVPADFLGPFPSVLAEILALHAVLRAEQMLEEILVTFARGTEKVGTPYEQITREVGRIVGIFTGEREFSALECLHDVIFWIASGGVRLAGEM